MALTSSDITTHAQDLKIRYADFVTKYANNLSYGKRCISDRDKLTPVRRIIRKLESYKAFTGDVTYGYKITFTKVSSGSDTVALTLNATAYTSYTDVGNGAAIAAYFANEINKTTSPQYAALASGNVLYAWSTDTTLTFADTITAPSTAKTTIATVSLSGEIDNTLEEWNCVTDTQICKMIEYAKALVPIDC
jgi:hypothetical protein